MVFDQAGQKSPYMPLWSWIRVFFLSCLVGGGIFFSPTLFILPTINADEGVSPTSPSELSKAPPPSASIVVATYEGVINPVAAEYFEEVIKAAEKEGAQGVVFQLDTPGGLDTSMRLIIKAMSASSVPVIVYVYPKGGRAASAGVFITLAADIAVMSPETNIGAAHPVAMGGGEMGKEMKKKVENDAAAYIKSIAEQHGRNAQWAEEAVRESVSVTETEALELNIIDLVAEDLTRRRTAFLRFSRRVESFSFR